MQQLQVFHNSICCIIEASEQKKMVSKFLPCFQSARCSAKVDYANLV